MPVGVLISDNCSHIERWGDKQIQPTAILYPSMDTARWAPDQLYGILWTPKFFKGFSRKHSNALHKRKSYSDWSRAHLAVSTERVPNKGASPSVNRVRLLLWATMAASMIMSSRSTNCPIAHPTSSAYSGFIVDANQWYLKHESIEERW